MIEATARSRSRVPVGDDDVGDGGGAHGVVGERAEPVEVLEVLRTASASFEP